MPPTGLDEDAEADTDADADTDAGAAADAGRGGDDGGAAHAVDVGDDDGIAEDADVDTDGGTGTGAGTAPVDGTGDSTGDASLPAVASTPSSSGGTSGELEARLPEGVMTGSGTDTPPSGSGVADTGCGGASAGSVQPSCARYSRTMARLFIEASTAHQ